MQMDMQGERYLFLQLDGNVVRKSCMRKRGRGICRRNGMHANRHVYEELWKQTELLYRKEEIDADRLTCRQTD